MLDPLNFKTFGLVFPLREIDPVKAAFCDVTNGLEHLYWLTRRADIEREWSDSEDCFRAAVRTRSWRKLRNWSTPVEFPIGWYCSFDFDCPPPIPRRWGRLKSTVDRGSKYHKSVRRSLYLGEYGLLSSSSEPARVVSDTGKTTFERTIDDLTAASARLAETGMNDWHKLTTDERRHVMWKWQRTAGILFHESIVTCAKMNVEIMWGYALRATRELARPEREQRILIDGTWIFERLGYLAHEAKCAVDAVPQALEMASWEEYAELMKELIEFAGLYLGRSDRSFSHPLTLAKLWAEAGFAITSGAKSEDEVEVEQVPAGAFATAFNQLRTDTLMEIAKLVPNRRAWWNEGMNASALESPDQAGTEIPAPPSGVDPSDHREPKPKTPARGRRRRRVTQKGLTDRQREAYEYHGEFRGDKQKAAEKMGISRATYDQHLDAAYRKLKMFPPQSPAKLSHRTQSLPHDSRGNANVQSPRNTKMDDDL